MYTCSVRIGSSGGRPLSSRRSVPRPSRSTTGPLSRETKSSPLLRARSDSVPSVEAKIQVAGFRECVLPSRMKSPSHSGARRRPMALCPSISAFSSSMNTMTCLLLRDCTEAMTERQSTRSRVSDICAKENSRNSRSTCRARHFPRKLLPQPGAPIRRAPRGRPSFRPPANRATSETS